MGEHSDDSRDAGFTSDNPFGGGQLSPRFYGHPKHKVYSAVKCTIATEKALLIEAPCFRKPTWFPKSVVVYYFSSIYKPGPDMGHIAVKQTWHDKHGPSYMMTVEEAMREPEQDLFHRLFDQWNWQQCPECDHGTILEMSCEDCGHHFLMCLPTSNEDKEAGNCCGHTIANFHCEHYKKNELDSPAVPI